METPDKFIQDIARKAGKVLYQKFGNVHRIRAKENPTDVVSEADLKANQIYLNAIRKKFPSHGIVSEESDAYKPDADYVWYIDPLDGSFNFVRGAPFFCTMVGLAYKGQMLLSVIYDPILDRLYFAKRGKGAYVNGKKIHCSKQKTWENSYGTSAAQLRVKEKIAFFERLVRHAKIEPFWLSSLGCIGLTVAYIAQGARDWVATLGCGAYESAVAGLLLEEAGCVVTTKQGKSLRVGDTSLIAANKYLHPKLMRLVKRK